MCFRRSVVSLPEVQCMISEPKSVEESTYSASLSFSNPRVDLDLCYNRASEHRSPSWQNSMLRN